MKYRKTIDKRTQLKKKICSTHSERLKDRSKEQYSESNKEVKKANREDQQNFVEDMAKETEKLQIRVSVMSSK